MDKTISDEYSHAYESMATIDKWICGWINHLELDVWQETYEDVYDELFHIAKGLLTKDYELLKLIENQSIIK